MDKMTKKVAFGLALDALDTIDTAEARMAWDIIQKEIARLEKASLRAKSGTSKADIAKAEFRQSVLELVTASDAKMRATEVADALGVSCQKASAALSALVKDGMIFKSVGEKRVTLFSATADEEEAIEG